MKTSHEIKAEEQKKLSDLFHSLGIFFAFSNKRFNEQREEGVTYVNLSCGMMIPKNNVEIFRKKYKELRDNTTLELRYNVSMENYIRDELMNHECFYSGDYTEIFELVKSAYPECAMEDIKRVYNSCIER